MNEKLRRKAIPVIVNCYNQPTYVIRFVSALTEARFDNIWLLDQASTNPDMASVLKLLEGHRSCRIFRLGQNMGPRWFFTSPLLPLAGNIFIYSDPDLEFIDAVPDDIVSRFIALSEKYSLGKVGSALYIGDHDQFISRLMNYNGKSYSIYDWEKRYWERSLENNVYDAPVDTTFALYNMKYFDANRFLRGIRVAGDYTMRHRPWYRDNRVSQQEWDFYLGKSQHSMWYNEAQADAAGGEAGGTLTR